MKEFHFAGCIEIIELLWKKADDIRRLMECIEEVPIDSIYYHTHSYFLRHFYIVGIYPNDFADWVSFQIRDKVLGEKLAQITPSADKNLEDIRTELLDTMDNHLSETKMVPAIVFGQQPFYFMQSKIIQIPVGVNAKNLGEFYDALKIIDASAVYNHVFEARLRDRLGRSDFAIWLDEVLGMKMLADNIERIDSYMYSLEGLRNELLALCDSVKSSMSKRIDR